MKGEPFECSMVLFIVAKTGLESTDYLLLYSAFVVCIESSMVFMMVSYSAGPLRV